MIGEWISPHIWNILLKRQQSSIDQALYLVLEGYTMLDRVPRYTTMIGAGCTGIVPSGKMRLIDFPFTLFFFFLLSLWRFWPSKLAIALHLTLHRIGKNFYLTVPKQKKFKSTTTSSVNLKNNIAFQESNQQ